MNKRSLAVIGAVALGLAMAHGAYAQTSGAAADNTKSNKLDQSNMSATADSQKENTADRTLTQQIRKSVIADKALSMYAHNVKIVAVNGTVTLNGVVRSEAEKSSVAAKAVAVAGQDHVVNALKIAADK